MSENNLTKVDLTTEFHKLGMKIEQLRSDLIRWMFIFWAGQTALLIGFITLFF